jgi:FAD/FMN-containing dehydrogenase
MKKYSKREFLKLMGLGIAFAPFISFFEACNSETQPDHQNQDDSTPTDTDKQPEALGSSMNPEDLILLKREDSKFKEYNQSFNGRIKKLPLFIALCKTTKGVQQAVRYAKTENLQIAVKSGGHSFEGFSNNNDGLVINLSQMKAIEWLDDNKVMVEPGCILQEIQNALFPRKRLIPTGSCGTVGIAGLALGGGYGFFSRKYGLTCDSIESMEIVDGLGQIHNTKDNKELEWALKGGGNGNFGVVTKFVFKTESMPSDFHAHVLKYRKLTKERFVTILEQWFTCTQTMLDEEFCAFVLNGSTLTILATSFGNKDALSKNIQTLVSLADSHSASTAALAKAMKRYYGRTGPILFKNASAGLYQSYRDIADIAAAIFEKVVQTKGMIYQINTLGGKINNPAFEEQSCYPHRALPYLSELQAYWEHPAQEPKLLDAFESIQSLIRNKGVTAQYRNYPDINFPDWEHAYYGKNYTKLQTLKKQFDPDGIFNYEQGIKA